MRTRCMALNDAQGSRVDFITSNATKAAEDDRKVVSNKDAGRGYAECNHIGNRLHTFGNIEQAPLPFSQARVSGQFKSDVQLNGH